MVNVRLMSVCVMVVAIGAGTIADRAQESPPLTMNGYRVLAADFHVHSSTWSDGALTPWGLVLEAERQGLDAIAITGHNQVSDSKVGRWFSEHVGGPIVLTGEEIVAPDHHVVAVGVDRVVDWRLSVADQAKDVHRQGGVAIAAHPLSRFWPAYDDEAMRALDGAEVCHPLIFGAPRDERELEAFAARGSLAAIGSSDFHGFGRLGSCRTYVFARDASAAGILDALRAHQTVVYGLGGRAYGDPALISLAATRPELQARASADVPSSWLDLVSILTGCPGLAGLVLTTRRRSD